ncbi:hypothetical protein OCH239_17660 [Roseivivax halodurans JCM 10272]|uniref:Uncharacterized protein n=1 Tax=Roseivivax halodurans JCM 10272 TaxID=1449350 RepID=X7EG92_9RHOB|nr:hypothetical protein OCH239_17660 [Roseivivax halodurans JCM 10272]
MRQTLALAALAALTAAGAASAQQGRACGPRDTVLEKLEKRYGETRQSVGLAANEQMVEVYASPETGTWTILMTSAAGVTCLMATGQAFAEWTETEAAGDPA